VEPNNGGVAKKLRWSACNSSYTRNGAIDVMTFLH